VYGGLGDFSSMILVPFCECIRFLQKPQTTTQLAPQKVRKQKS
jgi:hypothetical protein